MSSKHSAIISAINKACSRFPNTFDHCLLKGFERIAANCSNHFISERSFSHLRRLILAHYFLQKKIENALQESRNHLFFRLLHYESRVCFLSTFSLEQAKPISSQYLLRALQAFMPGIHEIPHSSFRWLHPELPYLVGYFELQKLRGKKLTAKKTRSLEKTIRKDLPTLIPDYTPTVFWPYNAEESYRQTLTLQREINNQSDLPHASIQFKGQTTFSLEFIIQLATPITSFSLNKVVHKLPSSVQLSHYYTFIKDGSCPTKSFIFSLHIPHDHFFENGVINLLHARRLAAKYLEVLTGPFRDYNGGLLEKQSQQFDEIKSRLTSKITSFHRFAENLFYSLRPIEMQFSLSFEKVEALFSAFSKAFNQNRETIISDRSKLILVVKSLNPNCSAPISQEINQLSVVYGECVLARFHYFSLVAKGAPEFIKATELSQKKNSHEGKVLRLNFREGPPASLNPHYIYRDIRCRVLSKLLFEGLVRLGSKRNVILTGAKRFSQPDPLTYLFKIRPHFWSNGEKVTAYHYEQSWKQALLSSDIPSEPFFLLKGARKIHEKQKYLDELGIQALEENVLKVSLEHSDPFFLEKLAHPLFFPNLSSTQQEPEHFNGPYLLKKNNLEELILEMNPYFWRRSHLYFDRVAINFLQDTDQILNAFNRGEVHWIGSPFNRIPMNSIHPINENKSIRPFWIYFNTQYPHFSSKRIRQALGMSIDRLFITNSILMGDTPIYSILPESNNPQTKKLF